VLVVGERIRVPLRELRFEFSRSSGPGGQNVNKVSSRATLRWAVCDSTGLPEDVRERFKKRFARRITSDGELLVSSQRFRDQGRNVADCLEKLRLMLLEVAEPETPRRPTRVPSGVKRRRVEQKRRVSEKKKLRGKVRGDDR
jgi:ribosome-associated protein